MANSPVLKRYALQQVNAHKDHKVTKKLPWSQSCVVRKLNKHHRCNHQTQEPDNKITCISHHASILKTQIIIHKVIVFHNNRTKSKLLIIFENKHNSGRTEAYCKF